MLTVVGNRYTNVGKFLGAACHAIGSNKHDKQFLTLFSFGNP